MVNFDSNYWYHLYVNQNDNEAFTGTNLLYKAGTTGAVFFTTFGSTNSSQRWQWYGITSTTYVLRSEDGGPDAFLSSKFDLNETTQGQTSALMKRGNVSDDSVFWAVDTWGDGTFFLSNSQNGTDWRLNKKLNGLVALSSNHTEPHNGQRWSFRVIEPINDTKFSTVDLPSMSSSVPPTNPTGSPSPSPSSNPASSSGGLSSGAQAGIGAGVGIIVLIALIVFGLFLWRRRKQKGKAPYEEVQMKHIPTPTTSEIAGGQRHEMGDESACVEIGNEDEMVKFGHEAVYEMPENAMQSQRLAELPNTTVRRNAS